MAQSEDETETRRNPFGLEGILSTNKSLVVTEPVQPGINFQPAEERPTKMPELHLRGIGKMSGKDTPTALLDIEGEGIFVVEVDDTISLQGLKGENVIRIVEITDISITVEAGSYGELIVVR